MKFYVMNLIGNNEVQDIEGVFDSFKEAVNTVKSILGYSDPAEGYEEDAEGNEKWWAFSEAHYDNTFFYSYTEWQEALTTVRHMTANWQYAIADEVTFNRLWLDKVIDDELARIYA